MLPQEYRLSYTAQEIDEKLGQIDNKLNISDLAPSIENVLIEVKNSGEFNGEPGYTPQKGIDYYTETDKLEMVQAVLAALPDGEEVSY